MTAPTEPLKLWVCLCCGETWKDTADLIPGGGGYGHFVSPDDLCGEVVEYAPVVARDPAAELRAAAQASITAFDEWMSAHGASRYGAQQAYFHSVGALRAALAATEGSE